MKRRLICILLAAVLMLALPLTAFADYDYASVPTPKLLVVDGEDPTQEFFARAADEKSFPASTTKIMTCILALESGTPMDAQVTVGEEVKKGFTEHSSLMKLEIGETVAFEDLLYGLMLVSGNDAAAAIAVYLAGSVSNFADKMNAKAAELGMTNTHFVNPHGVHNDDHYTTARDMAKLAAYAIQNEQFKKIVSTATHTVPASNLRAEPKLLENTNKLIHRMEIDTETCLYEYAIGIKTGDTPKAGKCLVAAAEKDGATIIMVMFGDANDAQYSRFWHAAKIFESLFEEKYMALSGTDLQLQTNFPVQIQNARPEDLDALGQYVLSADVSALKIRALPIVAQQYRNNAGNIQAEVEWTHSLTAPISAGTTLGTVRYMLGGKEIYSFDLKTSTDILETAIIEPVPADPTVTESGNPAGSLLTQPTQAPTVTGKQDGPSLLVIFLIVLLVITVVFMLLVIIVRARKRAIARRKRQRRLEMQRRRQAEMRRRQQHGDDYRHYR